MTIRIPPRRADTTARRSAEAARRCDCDARERLVLRRGRDGRWHAWQRCERCGRRRKAQP